MHHDTWLPSSYNPVGAGSMAFFETLQDLHWPVERWREPLSRLDAYGKGNVLIVTRSKAGAPPVNFSDQENSLLLEWTKQGNTLVLLGDLGQLGRHPRPHARDRLRRTRQNAERERSLAGLRRAGPTSQ